MSFLVGVSPKVKVQLHMYVHYRLIDYWPSQLMHVIVSIFLIIIISICFFNIQLTTVIEYTVVLTQSLLQ